MNTADYTKNLLAGAGIVLFILWGALSYAPLVDLGYDENGTHVWVNLFFISTSLLAFGFLYLPVRTLTYRAKRYLLDNWIKVCVPQIFLIGLAWITAYTLLV